MREYEDGDLKMINDWYINRNMPPLRAESLPEIGLIEPYVACGFLYQTDSEICLIEGFITNPFAQPERRNWALNMITSGICTKAKELGFKKVCAFTTDPTIESRAYRHDFKNFGKFLLLTKGL